MWPFKKKNKEFTEKWYLSQLKVSSFCYIHNDILDMFITKCISFGIRTIICESHYMNILFNNDIEMRFWDANRYYAWISSGTIKDLQNNKILYTWYNEVPSAKTMWTLRNMINEWHGNYLSREYSELMYENILKTLNKFAPKNEGI